MTDLLPDVVVVLLSAGAVIVSLFRARAEQTQAAAAAVSELASVSHDLRDRIRVLEEENRTKQRELHDLRQHAARIPHLEAQVRRLGDELAQVRLSHNDERARLLRTIAAKDREIKRLRARLNEAAAPDSA